MRITLALSAAMLGVALAAAGQQSPDELLAQYRKAAAEAQQRGHELEAEKYLRAALAVAETFGPQDRRLALALNNLASHLQGQGQDEEAIALHKRVLSLCEQQVPPNLRLMIITHNNLAMIYDHGEEGGEVEAERHLKKALELAQSVDRQDPDGLRMILNNLGQLYFRQKRYADAEVVYQQSLEVARGDTRRPFGRAVDAACLLAQVYQAQGKYSDAEYLLLGTVFEQEQRGEVDSRLGQALIQLADYHRAQKEFELAATLYERALNVYEKSPRERGSASAAHCMFLLAGLYAEWGLPDKAETLYLRELEIENGLLGQNYRAMPMSLIGLGNFYREQGRLEEIVPLARRALAILEGRIGAENQGVANGLIYISGLNQELGDNMEAERLLRRGIAIQEKCLGPQHPQIAGTLRRYAGVLLNLGREAESARIMERAAAIDSRTHPAR